jgi:DNA-binding transcriptional MocR family regulator
LIISLIIGYITQLASKLPRNSSAFYPVSRATVEAEGRPAGGLPLYSGDVSTSKLATAIPVAGRVNAFSYAIRNIVAEAQRVEATGMRVRYLNVGDPNAFGFKTPPHLIAAVERAMRDGHNGYGPSPGIPAAREAVAAELTAHGFPISADRALITAGTSEAIDLVLGALVDGGGEVLVPMPT